MLNSEPRKHLNYESLISVQAKKNYYQFTEIQSQRIGLNFEKGDKQKPNQRRKYKTVIERKQRDTPYYNETPNFWIKKSEQSERNR